ncbi:cell wall-active antibiotics response protein LiaF [Virgibacillus kimchii]
MRRFIRYFLAIFLVVVGIVLVLTNLGLVEYDFSTVWAYIYPVFFVVIGSKWLIDYLKRQGGTWVFGSFFLIFGTLLLLDRFDVISFVFRDVLKLWPLLIVYIGFMIFGVSSNRVVVLKNNGGKKAYYSPSKSFVGSHEYNSPNWKVEPMNISNMAGDYYFDFTKAFIPEEKIPIMINSLAGDVNIILPENVDFRVDASVKAGEIEIVGQRQDGIQRSLQYETVNYDTAIQKIDFTIKLKAGSIRIDQA